MASSVSRIRLFLALCLLSLTPHAISTARIENIAGEQDGPTIDKVIIAASDSNPQVYHTPGTDGSPCEVIIEGDIVVSCKEWNRMKNPSSISARSNIISNPRRLWPTYKPIRFTFDIFGRYSRRDRRQVRSAMADIEKHTCVSFREASFFYPRKRLLFTNGRSCYSSVGMTRRRNQEISLRKRGCRNKAFATREILHALGFFNEHSRTDRDEYITINYENIRPVARSIFSKVKGLLDLNVTYDYRSLMHYGAYAFSRNGKPTITTKDPAFQNVIGRAREMSYLDIKSLNLAYKCAPARCEDVTCADGGFVDKNCQCQCDGGRAGVIKTCGELWQDLTYRLWDRPQIAFLLPLAAFH